MTKKYRINEDGRVVALRDFGYVKKGDIGGFIEKEGNLSHEGNSWIYGNAKVSGNALVSGDARVFGDAEVYGNALVSGNAAISGGTISKGSPFYIQGSKFVVNLVNKEKGLVRIGCQEHTIEYWIKNAKKIAKINNCVELYDEYIEYLIFIRDKILKLVLKEA